MCEGFKGEEPVLKFGRRDAVVVAAGVPPAVELGILPSGEEIHDDPDVSVALPGGKMPPSTAGEPPAATFLRHAQRSETRYLVSYINSMNFRYRLWNWRHPDSPYRDYPLPFRVRACVKNAAADVSPAVEGGILPPGDATESAGHRMFSRVSAGQDAQRYGRREACRYNLEPASSES